MKDLIWSHESALHGSFIGCIKGYDSGWSSGHLSTTYYRDPWDGLHNVSYQTTLYLDWLRSGWHWRYETRETWISCRPEMFLYTIQKQRIPKHASKAHQDQHWEILLGLIPSLKAGEGSKILPRTCIMTVQTDSWKFPYDEIPHWLNGRFLQSWRHFPVQGCGVTRNATYAAQRR